jgi:toxin ParE1/3/4
MRRVILTPAARADFLDAVDWYAEHAPPVVPRIRAEMRTLTARIAAVPQQFPPGPKNTRRALLQHFPYVVIFIVTGDAIHVVAFFHTSRDPVQWRKRV